MPEFEEVPLLPEEGDGLRCLLDGDVDVEGVVEEEERAVCFSLIKLFRSSPLSVICARR